MVDGVKCPKCGSEQVALVIYGMPAYDETLEEKIDAGDVVLNGCCIPFGEPMYPYECQGCGHRFNDGADRRPTAKAHFSEKDYAWIQYLADYWNRGEDGSEYEPFTDDEDLADDCAQLAYNLLNDDPQHFEQILEYDEAQTHRRYSNPTFARLVKLGLEYGVACKDGACANYLGALYYMGDMVEQDYNKAKELYELAEQQGSERAMLNLGYIYEYGRTGKSDYQRAFNQYAKVVALTGTSEAYYKLGDMYSRAKVVDRDLRCAYRLYMKSLSAAGGDVVMQAQPAIRIAKLISDSSNAEWGIPYNPMYAFELYQLAERGLRIDIAHGQTYYSKRLREALEGQERMRAVLDDPRTQL